MKKTKLGTKHTTAGKKPAAPEKKISMDRADDKDEKVQKHRATDIQKPVINKQ